MDALQFISAIVESLAWPLAVIVLVLILRAPLKFLLGELSRFKYGEVEIDFGREVQKLETDARTAGLNVPQRTVVSEESPPSTIEIVSDARRLAKDFPGPAVGLAWTAVEFEMTQAVMRLAISPDYLPHNAPHRNIQILQKEGYIDKNTRSLLDRMRNLRNIAVHPNHPKADGVRISGEEALEFIDLTEAITDKLRNITR